MAAVSKVLGHLVTSYFAQMGPDTQESRLLLPVATSKVGTELHSILVNSLTANVKPFLVVDGDTQKPSESQRWIRAIGLTSKRIGSMAIVAQPGQLSRIHESVAGTGGTVRQSFPDEWPWVREGENEFFSFTDEFLPRLVSLWTDDPAEQAWLRDFIDDGIVPALKESPDRAEYFFDEVLDCFSPDSGSELQDLTHRFLHHAGVPKPAQAGVDARQTARDLKRLCAGIASRLESVDRDTVLDNAKNLENGGSDIEAAIHSFFDSVGARGHSGIGLLAIADCVSQLSEEHWLQLDANILSNLFEIKARSKLALDASFVKQDVFVSADGKNAVASDGDSLRIEITWQIESNVLPASAHVLELRYKQRTLASITPTENSGKEVIELNLAEHGIASNVAKSRLTAKLYEKDSSSTHRPKSSTVTVYVMGAGRPCAAMLESPFTFLEPSTGDDESEPAGVTLNEPAYLFVFDSREHKDFRVTANDDVQAMVEDGVDIFRSATPIDPSSNPSAQVSTGIEFGDRGSVWLNLEATGRATGELNIEDELIQSLKLGKKKKVAEILEHFDGMADAPYAALGGIEESAKFRINVAKQFESGTESEWPVIVDISAKLSDLRLRGNVWFASETEVGGAQFKNLSISEISQALISAYSERREKVINIFREQYQGSVRGQAHPLCALSPVYLHNRSAEIETAICEYLSAYEKITEYLSSSHQSSWGEAFILTYLDCVVGASTDDSIHYPLFLIGPWHPLSVAQRYLRQTAIFVAAKRYLGSRNSLHHMAGVFSEIEGIKRVHALSDSAVSWENAYVTNTSDPNWHLGLRIGFSDQLERLGNAISRLAGLDLGTMPTGSEALTKSYVKRYLEANPSERRLEIRVRKGLDVAEIIRALQALCFTRETQEPTKYGRQLAGGIHLHLEEHQEGTLDDLGWTNPPICVYHVPGETEGQCLERNNIDIVIVAPGREIGFKDEHSSPPAIPRGNFECAGLTSSVTWLEQNAQNVASSVCHEVEVTPIESGNVVCDKLIESFGQIAELVPNYFHPVRPLNIPLNLRASWVVVPGFNADPSVFIQYVVDSGQAGTEKVLWEYSIDLEEKKSEYYILSEVPNGFRHAMSATKMSIHDETSIINDLGAIGIAIGSEALQTGLKALGAVGQVGAARLLSSIGQDDDYADQPLFDSEDSVGLLLPVDSFDSVLGTSSKDSSSSCRKSDLLAIQLSIAKQGAALLLSMSACSVECKFTGGVYAEKNVSPALDQAAQTHSRLMQLIDGAKEDGGSIERLVLARLVRYGLQLRRRGLRNSELSLTRDRTILQLILQGQINYKKPKYSCMLVSTECGESAVPGTSFTVDGLWVRLTPECWPDRRGESDALKKIRAKVADIFSEVVERSGPSSPETNVPQGSGAGDAPEVPQNQTGAEGASDSLPAGDERPSDAGTTDACQSERQHVDDTDDDSRPDDGESKGVRFIVGREMDREPPRSLYFWPSHTDLNQLNVGIVGDLGTGKTQLVKALMLHMHRSGRENRGVIPKFLIFDYKGDYTKDDFTTAMDARVLTPQNMPLNFFESGALGDGSQVDPAIERARFAYDTLKKIYGGLGPVQQMNLRSATKSAYQLAKSAALSAPTIYDVCNEYSEIVKGKPDAMLAILSGIVDQQLFERDNAKIQTLESLLEKSLVLDLKALGQDDHTKNMLVAIFLNIYYEYMLGIEKKPFLGPNEEYRAIDSTLVVDEADSIMKYNFPVLRNLLLQGREFGVGVWLASQYLSHFRTKEEDYKQPLLSWFIHKVPSVSTRELSEIGLVDVKPAMAERIKTLGKFECLYKTFDIPEGRFIQGNPFYMAVKTPE